MQVALLLKFCVVFVWRGLGNFPLTAVGEGTFGEIFSDVLGVAIFNFALCMMAHAQNVGSELGLLRGG